MTTLPKSLGLVIGLSKLEVTLIVTQIPTLILACLDAVKSVSAGLPSSVGRSCAGTSSTAWMRSQPRSRSTCR